MNQITLQLKLQAWAFSLADKVHNNNPYPLESIPFKLSNF